jgi:hypothetical protein
MRTFILLAVCCSAALAQQAPSPASTPQSAPPAATPAAPAPGASQAMPPAPPPGQTAPPPPAAPAAPAMTPADAWVYAMEPFNNARSAPDDLTDADKWALSIAMARANQQCEVLKIGKLTGEDLLALGKLCILGEDYDPARASLIAYLAQPQAKSPEIGRLLLTRAFIGLHWVTSAESQLESLLSLYPYDASIHLGIDMVVDAAAASDAADDLDVIPRVSEQQLPHILDALAHDGIVPPSNGDSVDAAVLVRDALRIADALRRSYKPDEADKILAQVKTDIAAPSIRNSPWYPAIEAALTRYALFMQPSPLRALHGNELPPFAGPATRSVLLYDPDPDAHRIVRRINATTTSVRMLEDRTLVFVFSLAGPASGPTIHQILDLLAKDHLLPGLKTVAVTSFGANTGVDEASPMALDAIRAFHATLPPSLPVFIVPDSELKAFAIDAWPAVLLVDGKGRILWLNTLSGSAGSIRQMERDMENAPPQLPQ